MRICQEEEIASLKIERLNEREPSEKNLFLKSPLLINDLAEFLKSNQAPELFIRMDVGKYSNISNCCLHRKCIFPPAKGKEKTRGWLYYIYYIILVIVIL